MTTSEEAARLGAVPIPVGTVPGVTEETYAVYWQIATVSAHSFAAENLAGNVPSIAMRMIESQVKRALGIG